MKFYQSLPITSNHGNPNKGGKEASAPHAAEFIRVEEDGELDGKAQNITARSRKVAYTMDPCVIVPLNPR